MQTVARMLSASQDLNLAPSLHQSAALPTELDAVVTYEPLRGVEPRSSVYRTVALAIEL